MEFYQKFQRINNQTSASTSIITEVNKIPTLPSEILLIIFDKLPWKDVRNLRLVSKNVGQLALSTKVWRRTRVILTYDNYKEACLLLGRSLRQVTNIKIMIPTRVRRTYLLRGFKMINLLTSVPENVRSLVVQEAPAEKDLANPPEMLISGLDPDWFVAFINMKFDYVQFIERGYNLGTICETILTPEQMKSLVSSVRSTTQLFFGNCW